MDDQANSALLPCHMTAVAAVAANKTTAHSRGQGREGAHPDHFTSGGLSPASPPQPQWLRFLAVRLWMQKTPAAEQIEETKTRGRGGEMVNNKLDVHPFPLPLLQPRWWKMNMMTTV